LLEEVESCCIVHDDVYCRNYFAETEPVARFSLFSDTNGSIAFSLVYGVIAYSTFPMTVGGLHVPRTTPHLARNLHALHWNCSCEYDGSTLWPKIKKMFLDCTCLTKSVFGSH
jgi:hypothetical protein